MEKESPEKVFQGLVAYQQSAVLKAAIDLDLFTAIGEGATTVGKLAARCKAAERGIRSLCNYLVVAGFLTGKDGDYGLAATSATYLDRRSPGCIASISRFLCAPELMQAFDDVAGAVRRGGTLLGEAGLMAPDHSAWVEFARGMEPLARMQARTLADCLAQRGVKSGKILDVAAGHGLYGIELARRTPEARAVALDWKNVLPVAVENARAAGIEDRFQVIEGDALQVDLGGPYDLVLITNFLHHFDAGACREFLGRVHAALAPEGYAVTIETLVNEDGVTPPDGAAFSLVMLMTTAGGDSFTAAGLKGLLADAGFSGTNIELLPESPQSAIISRR